MNPREGLQRLASQVSLSSYDNAVAAFRGRCLQLLTLKHTLFFGAFWGFVWGTVVLVARLALGHSGELLLWGWVGLVPAFVLAVTFAMRQRPSPGAVRALLDQQSRCGGLLMAREEASLGGWGSKLPSPNVPLVQWRSGRAVMTFLVAVLFVAGSFLAPQRMFASPPANPLDISEQVKKLSMQLKTLKQEKVLEKTEASELEKQLKKIQQEALGKDPVKTWQALDHLQRQNKQNAKKAAEKSLSQTEQWTRIQREASELQKNLTKQNPAELAKAMKALSKHVRKSLKSSYHLKLSKHLPKSLRKALSKRMISKKMLTKKQLKMLKKSAGACKGSISGHLKKLRRAGLISSKVLKFNKKLASFKKKGKPGSGGISRGRGDAPMTWKKATELKGKRFKEKALPPAQLLALQQSQTVGMSTARPQKTPKTNQPGAVGALRGAKTHQSSARKHVILPRYTGTIKRFFHRSK